MLVNRPTRQKVNSSHVTSLQNSRGVKEIGLTLGAVCDGYESAYTTSVVFQWKRRAADELIVW